MTNSKATQTFGRNFTADKLFISLSQITYSREILRLTVIRDQEETLFLVFPFSFWAPEEIFETKNAHFLQVATVLQMFPNGKKKKKKNLNF